MRTRSPSWWASDFNPRTPRGVRRLKSYLSLALDGEFQSTHPARGATAHEHNYAANPNQFQSTHPARGATAGGSIAARNTLFQSTHPARGATTASVVSAFYALFQSTHPARGATLPERARRGKIGHFNPRTPRGVRQQTLPKSREFAWLNLLICTRGRRLSIRKQTRLCSMKLSFMLFGCEPAGEGVSSWTSHATKSKVRLEGRSAYSQSVRSSAHSDFPGNKSGGCPVRDP